MSSITIANSPTPCATGCHAKFDPVLEEHFLQRLPESISRKLNRFDLKGLGTIVIYFINEKLMMYADAFASLETRVANVEETKEVDVAMREDIPLPSVPAMLHVTNTHIQTLQNKDSEPAFSAL